MHECLMGNQASNCLEEPQHVDCVVGRSGLPCWWWAGGHGWLPGPTGACRRLGRRRGEVAGWKSGGLVG